MPRVTAQNAGFRANPRIVPRAGVKYFDTYDWDFTVTTKEEVRLRMKELLHR